MNLGRWVAVILSVGFFSCFATALPIARCISYKPELPALINATIDSLANGLQNNQFTSVNLAYIRRILEVNSILHAVTEINIEAFHIAAQLDAERAHGIIRGPLHGIPILVKDNIATKDKLSNTAGSFALLGSTVSEDSTIARKLREAGAILLGKTNLSEWANYRSSNSVSGWSAVGGQTYGAYYHNQDPNGSSSGSAVASSLGLATGSIGTETDGSMILPASWGNVVGVKPTVGLTSRNLVVPISEHLDTVGPITTNVKDAAIILQALAGVDPKDNYTSAIPNQGTIPDYVAACNLSALEGARIGIPRNAMALRAHQISKVSLKNGRRVVPRRLEVLSAVRGAGPFANALFEEVLWDNIDQSLIRAGFPDNQLLEFLPLPMKTPWIYVASEWDPTWTMDCIYDDDVILDNVTGSGDADFYHAIDAFLAYKELFDTFWLESLRFRVTSDFSIFQDWSRSKQMREVLFFTLLQSDPGLNDNFLYNNETLVLTISVLHARDFKASFEDTGGVVGGLKWMPTGLVGYASYSRVNCTLTRKSIVEDENKIPWPWTNDTASIVKGFMTYYMSSLTAAAAKEKTVHPPSARDLLRFYQVYMASINTAKGSPITRKLSVKAQTVELSVIFLVILITIFLLTLWNSIQYGFFLRCNKKKLKELYLPNGRIEWMVHTVKTSQIGMNFEADPEWANRKDGEYFCSALIRADSRTDNALLKNGIQAPKLARVQSYRGSCMSSIPSKRVLSSPFGFNLKPLSGLMKEISTRI